MANEVYANGREIACKAASGKTVAAFPDTCLSPPSSPAGPVPIPYPNTAYASDTTNGSTTVMISGKEVMLKDKSVFKKSTGNEAATKSLGMGVVTHTIQGEASFTSWSMDVKIEGQNVDRHLDTTINNEQCFPSNTGPWPYVDAQAVAPGGPCHEEAKRAQDACKNTPDPCAELGASKPIQKKRSPSAAALADKAAAEDCVAAQRCFLQPYDADKSKCCYPQTGHHLIEASALFEDGRGGAGDKPLKGVNTGTKKYDENEAPCVCAEGTFQYNGTHGLMHTLQSAEAAKLPTASLALEGGGSTAKQFHKTTFKGAKTNGINAMKKVFPESYCGADCLEKQLDNYHNQCGLKDDTEVKGVTTGNFAPADVEYAEAEIRRRTTEILQDRMTSPASADALAESLGLPTFPFR